MPKGKFQKPIPVDYEYLTDKTLCPGGIRVFRNGFSVTIRYTLPEQKKHLYSPLTVRYYGSAKNDRMWVNSFSYSVQHLPEEAQKEINKNPFHVAKYGLEVVGVAF